MASSNTFNTVCRTTLLISLQLVIVHSFSGAHRLSSHHRTSFLKPLLAVGQNDIFQRSRKNKINVPALHASSFVQKSVNSTFSGASGEHDFQNQASFEYTDLLDESIPDGLPKLPIAEDAFTREVQSRSLSNVWQARILLLISAALYGTNFTVVKILNENMPVNISTALRFILAAVATLPWLLQPIHEETQDLSERKDNDATDEPFLLGDLMPFESTNLAVILAGLETGIWSATGYVTQAVGLETTQASTSAFICSLAVVVVPILDFISGKKLGTREIIGAAMAVFGVALLELDGLSLGASGPLLSKGDLFSLVQPLVFGMGFWRMEHAMRRYPSEATKLTAAQLLAVGAISVSFCLGSSGLDGLPDLSQITNWITQPLILGSIVWTGLITTALTIYMETLALKTLSAAETTMIFSTEPLFGSAFAAVMLGEAFGVGGAAGASMILGGCILSNLKSSEKDPDGKII